MSNHSIHASTNSTLTLKKKKEKKIQAHAIANEIWKSCFISCKLKSKRERENNVKKSSLTTEKNTKQQQVSKNIFTHSKKIIKLIHLASKKSLKMNQTKFTNR